MTLYRNHRKKILLFGSTGKIGTALAQVLMHGYAITGKSSRNFNAFDFAGLTNILDEIRPDIIINAVVHAGLDACEVKPEQAFALNTLFPKSLAELSRDRDILLVQLSTDAVFDGAKRDYYTEDDCARPVNIYGITKYAADTLIQAITPKHLICRTSLQFGETGSQDQFVEKMLNRIRSGQKSLSVSEDIILSPTYNRDLALSIKELLEADTPWGLYHMANQGMASLFDLIHEIVSILQLDIRVTRTTYKTFPSVAMKNTFTPLASTRFPPMRRWQDAVAEYCSTLRL